MAEDDCMPFAPGQRHYNIDEDIDAYEDVMLGCARAKDGLRTIHTAMHEDGKHEVAAKAFGAIKVIETLEQAMVSIHSDVKGVREFIGGEPEPKGTTTEQDLGPMFGGRKESK